MALCAEGKRPACLEALRAAAAREDASEKHAVTPGRLVPAREVLAYATLDGGDAVDGAARVRKRAGAGAQPAAAFAGAADAAQRAGEPVKAKEYSAKVVELTEDGRHADRGSCAGEAPAGQTVKR